MGVSGTAPAQIVVGGATPFEIQDSCLIFALICVLTAGLFVKQFRGKLRKMYTNGVKKYKSVPVNVFSEPEQNAQ